MMRRIAVPAIAGGFALASSASSSPIRRSSAPSSSSVAPESVPAAVESGSAAAGPPSLGRSDVASPLPAERQRKNNATITTPATPILTFFGTGTVDPMACGSSSSNTNWPTSASVAHDPSARHSPHGSPPSDRLVSATPADRKPSATVANDSSDAASCAPCCSGGMPVTTPPRSPERPRERRTLRDTHRGRYVDPPARCSARYTFSAT